MIMQQGDFTVLAKHYSNRPAYSTQIVHALLKYTGYDKNKSFKVADIGAGTGKFTKVLLDMGLEVDAVEPNDQMREEGTSFTKEYSNKWVNGRGENTYLDSNAYNWAVMASSFHWTNPKLSLPEFFRILKPNGYFTAIWNPRNVEKNELHSRIENIIYEIAPHIKRVSSGGKGQTKNWEEIIISTGHFKEVIFMETDYEEIMSVERYLGAWKSVNDIRVQAGTAKFQAILEAIETEIKEMKEIVVPYKMRAWSAQKV